MIKPNGYYLLAMVDSKNMIVKSAPSRSEVIEEAKRMVKSDECFSVDVFDEYNNWIESFYKEK